jgi:hypothetical protein
MISNMHRHGLEQITFRKLRLRRAKLMVSELGNPDHFYESSRDIHGQSWRGLQEMFPQQQSIFKVSEFDCESTSKIVDTELYRRQKDSEGPVGDWLESLMADKPWYSDVVPDV